MKDQSTLTDGGNIGVFEYDAATGQDVKYATLFVRTSIDLTSGAINVESIQSGGAYVYGRGKSADDFEAWLIDVTGGRATCPGSFISHIESYGI